MVFLGSVALDAMILMAVVFAAAKVGGQAPSSRWADVLLAVVAYLGALRGIRSIRGTDATQSEVEKPQ